MYVTFKKSEISHIFDFNKKKQKQMGIFTPKNVHPYLSCKFVTLVLMNSASIGTAYLISYCPFRWQDRINPQILTSFPPLSQAKTFVLPFSQLFFVKYCSIASKTSIWTETEIRNYKLLSLIFWREHRITPTDSSLLAIEGGISCGLD